MNNTINEQKQNPIVVLFSSINLKRPANIPKYATTGSACMDISAHLETDASIIVLQQSERKAIPTGFVVELPEGYQMEIRPRSGISLRTGLGVHLGTIDHDFRGEVHIIVSNYGEHSEIIKHGDRIAQCIVSPAPKFEFKQTELNKLSQTVRGTKGFGSTGV